ncbi:MAG: hypothetical protein R6X17_13125 [Candidatus Competibacteraceae bacterium]
MSSEQLQIDLSEAMDVDQRSWLVAKLEDERGIISAWFDDENHHRLIVHYEREHFSHTTLLDTIKEHGFHGKIVGD